MSEPATETVRACPLCGSDASSAWRSVRDASRAEMAPPLHYRRCHECHAVFLRDRVLEADLSVLYSEDYEPYESSAAPAAAQHAPPTLRARLGALFGNPAQDAIDAHYTDPPPGARLLDFGCGNPRFITTARELGWEPVGVDFPESVLATIRAAGVVALSVEEARRVLEPGSFDAIRLSHVLEHLYDPRDTIGWLRGLLRSGGVLHLSVPNPAGVSARLFRQHWKALEPRHVILYPPRTVERLLLGLGSTEVQIAHETLSKDAVRSAGLLVARHTSLTVADAMRWSDHRASGTALRPLAWAAARLRFADRYHAFARF